MPFFRQNRPTLAYIDHPNNKGWKLHFCSGDAECHLQYEAIDETGEVIMWEVLTRKDPRVDSYTMGSTWIVNLPLLGHYRLSPSGSCWNVYRMITEERPVMTSNSFRPVER